MAATLARSRAESLSKTVVRQSPGSSVNAIRSCVGGGGGDTRRGLCVCDKSFGQCEPSSSLIQKENAIGFVSAVYSTH